MRWTPRAQCSHHGSVPDMLCDRNKPITFSVLFISSTVNQGMPCLSCVPAGKWISNNLTKAKAKSHSSEALLEILPRPVMERHT